ncbi:MAG: GNAT family N-acetyltransferase [Candidatus Cloacimonetes bacterium]|nr:GNAT family N-acetyltransferase [Candidatus Cloacimonadota bacterium]
MNIQNNIDFFIQTKRLTIRPFTLEDIAKIYQMSLENGMKKWIPDQVYKDLTHTTQVVNFLNSQIENKNSPNSNPIVLGVYINNNSTIIGHIGLSPAKNQVEIGYAIEDANQGKGYATEAVKCFTQWAFKSYHLKLLLGIVDVKNTGSCKVLENSKFKLKSKVVADQATYTLYNPVFK